MSICRKPDFKQQNDRTNLELAFLAGAGLMLFVLMLGYVLGVVS